MERTAVFIDAGYLFAAGSTLVANERLPRSELHLDHEVLLAFLTKLVGELTQLPLLRIYWYDGTATGPTSQQLALGYRPGVKLRLGYLNREGVQQGVDSLIVNDLIQLARNRAMADAVLLTGDEDLRVGVLLAQEYGVRVHLLGIEPRTENQSSLLVQDADSLRELTRAEVQSFLSCGHSERTGAHPLREDDASIEAAATSRAGLEAAAERMAQELSREELAEVLKGGQTGSVPTPIDRRLLVASTQATGGAPLTPEQKRRVRAMFFAECRKTFQPQV